MVTNATTIWVNDPTSNKQVNVGPFLAVLNAFDAKPGSVISTGGTEVIQRTLRRLNLTAHDQSVTSSDELVNLYHDLHLLGDMFMATEEKADTN